MTVRFMSQFVKASIRVEDIALAVARGVRSRCLRNSEILTVAGWLHAPVIRSFQSGESRGSGHRRFLAIEEKS
jgi:hypothetical protein